LSVPVNWNVATVSGSTAGGRAVIVVVGAIAIAQLLS
jgi:hypothetical protein